MHSLSSQMIREKKDRSKISICLRTIGVTIIHIQQYNKRTNTDIIFGKKICELLPRDLKHFS